MRAVSWDGTELRRTARLVLRRYRRTDLPVLDAMNRDPEVMRFLGHAHVPGESDAFIEDIQRWHAECGLGMMAVERASDGVLLGMCGLDRVPWYPDDVEIGWRLPREHWGHGYATEAARAWLEVAFGTLALPRVISVADVPNLRSQAVMLRLGMVRDHEADLADDDGRFRAVVHVLPRERWVAQSASSGGQTTRNRSNTTSESSDHS
jgi:RimJ/RimL family protein N-acetyltransferase